MDDDLNTADALGVLFELVRDINTRIAAGNLSKKTCETALEIFDSMCGILGILYDRKQDSLDDEVEAKIQERTQARKNKDWALADKIRDELKSIGIVLEDTPQGVKWSREQS